MTTNPFSTEHSARSPATDDSPAAVQSRGLMRLAIGVVCLLAGIFAYALPSRTLLFLGFLVGVQLVIVGLMRVWAIRAGEEIMAVFDAYADDVDDRDVRAVDVTLAGPKEAVLSSGEGIHVTMEMVEDLLGAQAAEHVLNYRREAYPVLPSVSLELTPTDFGGVVQWADRYDDAQDIDLVEVASGGFVLVRDEVNEDLAVTEARERLVRRIEARFDLQGAAVSGRGPLELIVAPPDEEAVRRFTGAQALRCRTPGAKGGSLR